MRLDKQNTFIDLIKEASKFYDIDTSFTEKDYWVISLLKDIMYEIPDLVFKGGTSLSKCHHIINRFSEDIDISYKDKQPGESARSRINHKVRDVIANFGLTISNLEQTRSKRIFNRNVIPYESYFINTSVSKNIVVEMAFQTPCFPYEIKKVQTFIGQYLEEIGRNDLVKQYELEPFDVVVQKLERTFVDKVFALADYYISEKEEKQSRHIYDLSMILPHITLNEELATLFKSIHDIRKGMPYCYSAEEGVKIEKVFEELVNKKSFQAAYNKSTFPLLYDGKTYKECEPDLQQIVEYLQSDIFKNIYYND